MLKCKSVDKFVENKMSIVNYGELIDALTALKRSEPIIVSDLNPYVGSVWLDGTQIYYAFETLRAYNLIEKFNPNAGDGEEPLPFCYYRLNIAGMAYANRSIKEWKSIPIWKRALIRFCL